MTLNPFAVSQAATPAWHQLGGALTALADEGRSTPCQSDPAPFTSEDYRERAEAVTACRSCPVAMPCQRFAELNGERFGVWGGRDRGPGRKPKTTQLKEAI